MEQEMRVLCIEGVAIHGGPEPCVGRSRGWRRSVGSGRAGWVIELRNHGFGVPTLFRRAEGNIVGGAICEPSANPARSENLEIGRASCRERVEGSAVAGPTEGRAGRAGKAEAVIP